MRGVTVKKNNSVIMSNKFFLIILFVGGLLLLLTGCTIKSTNANSNTNVVASVNVNTVTSQNTNAQASANINTAPMVKEFIAPIDRPAERLTKKPFGIYITPKTSPIQPERFTGFHTGVDFETFADEADTDVKITASCTGMVRVRQRVSGYGGVLIQDCVLAGGKVTILYGHLNIDSITVKVGETLSQSGFIGNLGKGYSTQTDGERKHLHLSIHKGTAIDYKGYVSTEAALVGWLNPQSYL